MARLFGVQSIHIASSNSHHFFIVYDRPEEPGEQEAWLRQVKTRRDPTSIDSFIRWKMTHTSQAQRLCLC
jgi:hypothetical protein